MTINGRLALVVLVVSAMPIGQVRPQAGPVIEDPEAYEVYAAVLRQGRGSDTQPPETIAVLDETRAGMPDCPRDAAIQAEWRSAAASYRRENGRVSLILGGFNLGVPYSVVTIARLRKLMQDAGYTKDSPQTNAPGSRVFRRFPAGRLTALSAVGFNAERTRAIVTMQYNCFPSLDPGTESPAMCAEGMTLLMEKKDGRWVRATASGGCQWIA